jgi:hypothetical protein
LWLVRWWPSIVACEVVAVNGAARVHVCKYACILDDSVVREQVVAVSSAALQGVRRAEYFLGASSSLFVSVSFSRLQHGSMRHARRMLACAPHACPVACRAPLSSFVLFVLLFSLVCHSLFFPCTPLFFFPRVPLFSPAPRRFLLLLFPAVLCVCKRADCGFLMSNRWLLCILQWNSFLGQVLAVAVKDNGFNRFG